MKRMFVTSLCALAASSLFAVESAHATACTSYTTGGTVGSTSDVMVNNISVAGSGSGQAVSFSAAECVGAYAGNAIPLPDLNLGYAGDGLFNGAQQDGKGGKKAAPTLFPNGIFSDQYTAQDLNHDGKADPGWIYLGSWTPGSGFAPATIGGTSTIVLKDWFSITMNAAGNGGGWSFNPDANVVSRALPVLGPHLFDQFALSFMSGNTFAAYDFTAKEFGFPVTSSTIFDFSGTWDMSHTLFNNGSNAGGLSHIDLYVRDPNGPLAVPEPASAALLAIGLAGLGFSRRRKTT